MYSHTHISHHVSYIYFSLLCYIRYNWVLPHIFKSSVPWVHITKLIADQFWSVFSSAGPLSSLFLFLWSQWSSPSAHTSIFYSSVKAKLNSHFLLEVFIVLNIVVWYPLSLNSLFSGSNVYHFILCCHLF